MRVLAVALTLTAAVACDEIVAVVPAPDAGSPTIDKDAAVPPPAPQCASGLRPLPDGSCQAPGIVACAEGFTLDARGACSPVLPAADCPAGQIALPGDKECHELMACPPTGSPWGDIPDGATTRHVDGSYAGANSDGTRAKPFKTIDDALAVAVSGDTIGIAAGKYEHFGVKGKRLDVRGVCPRLVEIHASTPVAALAFIGEGSEGSSVSGVALTGLDSGFLTSNSNMRIERVWVHDIVSFGIAVSNQVVTPAKLIARDVLLENNVAFATVAVQGGELDIANAVVRDTFVDATGDGGRAFDIEESLDPTGPRSKAKLDRIMVERNAGVAVYISGSDGDLSRVVIRDTVAAARSAAKGRALGVQYSSTHGPSKVTFTNGLIERNQEVGVIVSGAELTMEDSVVRDTQPMATGNGGIGVQLEPDVTTRTSGSLTMRRCLVDANTTAGIGVISGTGTLESVLVRGTLPRKNGTGGVGIVIQYDSERITKQPLRSKGSLRWSAIEDVHVVGLGLLGSDVELEGVRIEKTKPRLSDGAFGDGLSLVADLAPATVAMKNTLIKDSARAGLSNFSGSAKVEDSTFHCNQFDLNGESLGGKDFAFEAVGINRCGCKADVPCQAVSEALTPPPAVP